jgi:hypothetical protein
MASKSLMAQAAALPSSSLARSSIAIVPASSLSWVAVTSSSSWGDRGRARDRRGHRGPRDLPGDRDLARFRVVLLGHLVERLEDAQPARVEVLLGGAGAARALGRVGLGAVLAGEEAGGQRIEVDHADLALQAQRLEIVLEHGAVVEVVQRLQALVARDAQALGDVERLGQPRRGEVRGADGAHLAGLHEVVEGTQRVLERRVGVVVVRLVEVDVVGLQALERGLDRLADVGRREPDLAFAHRLAELGGQHHAAALAALLEPLADDGLGLAAAVGPAPSTSRRRRCRRS